MGRPWLFEFGALLYGIMTAQSTWRASCARLIAYCPYPTRRILDLGCGPGVSTITLAQAQATAVVVGVDLAPRMLTQSQVYTARAGLSPRVGYVLADAGHLPFADGTWDLITGHSFLYLVPDRDRVVTEAYRVLRHGGRIASMEPAAYGVRWRAVLGHWREIRYLVSVLLWRPYSRWHGQLSSESFRNLLIAAGFSKTAMEPVLDGLGLIGSGEKS